jgi:hypothetical protein
MTTKFVSACLILAACGAPGGGKQAIAEGQVSKANFESVGKRWPLSMDRGRVGCTGQERWFEAENGIRYGLNGTADASGKYARVEPIWLPDEKPNGELKAAGATGPWLKVNIGDLIEEAGHFCR